MTAFRLSQTAQGLLGAQVGTAPTAATQARAVSDALGRIARHGAGYVARDELESSIVDVEFLGAALAPGPHLLLYAPAGSTLLAALVALAEP